jgi:membrane protease YdiL (CAAX protease family)
MSDFIRKHPVACYFALAITISWAGILTIVWPTSLPSPPEVAARLFVPVYIAMLLGPSVSGIAITALTGGTSGLRDFRNRLLRWRVDARWYAAALLSAPLLLAITLVPLSLISPEYAPALLTGTVDSAGLVHTGGTLTFVATSVAIGIGAGFFEELGWTGVAVPRLLQQRGLLATGLGVGVVWGAWHYLAIHWGSANAIGDVPIVVYLAVALFSTLPPYRVLMVWVYQRTQSLLIGILMHASLTSSLLLFGPALSGWASIRFNVSLAAVMWIVVLVVRAVQRPRSISGNTARSVAPESP